MPETPEVPEEGLINTALSVVGRKYRPTFIALLALVAFACVVGWLDQRAKGFIVEANAEALAETHAKLDDHERRLSDVERLGRETHDTVIEIRSDVKVLSDHDRERYSRGR